MSTSRRAALRIAAAVTFSAVLLALALAVFLIPRNQADPEEPGMPDRRGMPGFHEDAERVGITFQMKYLPGEQGEKFINEKLNPIIEPMATAAAQSADNTFAPPNRETWYELHDSMTG